MSITYEDPPCQVEEILEFTLNFKNLQNFLGSLVNNNKEFLSKIANLTTRMEEVDKLNSDLMEQNNRLAKCEEKNIAAEVNIDNHQRKIYDLEGKIDNNCLVNLKKIIKIL